MKWVTRLFLIISLLAYGSVAFAADLELPDLSGKEITVYYMAAATYDVAAMRMAPIFEQLTGCKVRVVADPYLSLYEKEFTALVSGSDAYDVMQVAYQWDGQFVPFLEPLDEYIQSFGVNMEEFIPGVLNNCGYWDGKYYGIPNACDVYSFIYRTDIFEEKGLNIPTTWEDVNDVAAKLTTEDMYGMSLAGLGEQVGQFWSARYIGLGGKLLNESWEPLLEEYKDVGIKAAQLLIDLLQYCPPGTLSYGYPEQMQSFLSGRAAMAEVWPSFLRGPANNPDESKVVGKWAFAPYPKGTGELSGWSLGIPKSAKNKEAAFAWIALFTNEDNQKTFFKDIGIGPTRIAIYQDDTLLAEHPDLNGILPGLMNPVPRFRVAQSQEAYDFMDARVSAFLSGQITPEEFIKEVNTKWEELFSKDKPSSPYTGP